MTNRISSSNPWLIYLLWVGLCCLMFWRSLTQLLRYTLSNDNASHILLIPLIVAWLLHTHRAKIAAICSLDISAAFLFVIPAAIILGILLWKAPPSALDAVSLTTLAFVLLLIAGFIAVFGRTSAKAVWFSLAFMAFLIPLPEALLNRAIFILQVGSAAVAEWIFDLSGIPVLREGFVFHLPGLSIEVAKECSGIRSSIALVILALLLAHFAFSKLWKKAVFVMAGLVMMMVKNGVRIATLTILAKYVDPGFLFGRLHHEGGVVFFLVGLALLVPIYWLLKRGEPAQLQPGARTASI